ncbi:ribonuclease E/G [Aquibacillus kalidii]|uniref:ribonuclease E/G n=1 Tax=Aquibacillus kalidii TaxID=2762597 RepID=UPI0016450B5D|nr:ribonuclease E/G [Aquibacillus kalidii]
MVSLYLQTLTTEQTAVVVENKTVRDVIINRPGSDFQVGNVFVAKVVKVDKGLQAAFVDIGDEKPGFLQRKELPKARQDQQLAIESLITEGQRIIVQIEKEAYGNKGARLTANITLPGLDVVYLPYSNYVAASRKLPSESRERLVKEFEAFREGTEGAIIRTSSKDRQLSDVEEQYANLRKRWQELEQSAKRQKVPSSLWIDDMLSDRLIRKISPDNIEAIYVDRSDLAMRIRTTFPTIQDKVSWEKLIDQQLPITIEQLFESIMNPVVLGPKGVELYIEETEALTVIDVNTARFIDKGDKQQTVTKANCIAAITAAEQIRLRNISGIIIIDFIGMKTIQQQELVLKALRDELKKDSTRTEVYGFTKLGLVEMTRKRESQSLTHLIGDKTTITTPMSQKTNAYMLERTILGFQNSKVEAILIDVNESLYRTFKGCISFEKLREILSQEVYFHIVDDIASYQVKLTGTTTLIDQQIASISADSIDKV